MRTGSLAPAMCPGPGLGPGAGLGGQGPGAQRRGAERRPQPLPQLRLLYLRHSAAAGAAFPVAPVLLTTGLGLAGSWAGW